MANKALCMGCQTVSKLLPVAYFECAKGAEPPMDWGTEVSGGKGKSFIRGSRGLRSFREAETCLFLMIAQMLMFWVKKSVIRHRTLPKFRVGSRGKGAGTSLRRP